MLEKVIENWTSRLDYIRASRGSPMPEIIFKMVDKIVEVLQREELDLFCTTKELQRLSLLTEKISDFDDSESRALQLANVPVHNCEKGSFSDEKRDPDFERMSPRDFESWSFFTND
ncbi:hypothetical protein TNCV_2701231 [Trichonephila clavipes]|nr:hypothetical protein TNCV_2701231 [Trichonephila clavipes]